MNKKKKKQNGFTIVELVIVIAVIGILAAILIPTFSNLVKKAKQSADQQLVYHINEAVVANEVDNLAKGKNGTEATMYDTLQALENDYGFTIEKMTPRSGNDIIWDSVTNRFALVAKDGTVVYTDPNRPTTDMTNKAQMWRITEAGESLTDGYAHYLTTGWTGEVPAVATGVDVGDNDDITAVTYDSSSDASAVVRTNGGTLTVKAPNGTVNHYGEAESVNVVAVANNSYHENGTVKFVEISKGRMALETGAEVNHIHINAKVVNDVKQDVFDNIIIAKANDVAMPEFSRDDVEIATAGTLVVALQTGTEEVTSQTKLDYVWLTKQGVYEQITVSENKTEAGTNWVNTSNKPAETKTAAQQIANNIGTTATVGTTTYDVDFDEETRDIVLKETGTENVVYTLETQTNGTTVVKDSNNEVVESTEVAGAVTTAVESTVEAQPDKEDVQIGATYFAGGTGTANDPFLIYNYETMQHISTMSEYGSHYTDGLKWSAYLNTGTYDSWAQGHGYANYEEWFEKSFGDYLDYKKYTNFNYAVAIEKTNNGVIDCSEDGKTWVPVVLSGNFDGKGVIFNNATKGLFDSANGDEVVIKNFTLNVNISVSGGVGAVVYDSETLNLTIDSVDVHGTIIGANWVTPYVEFGPGKTCAWNLTIKNSVSDATLVATSGVASGFVGHPYNDVSNGADDKGHLDGLSTITIIDSAYTGNMSATGNPTKADYYGFKYFTINGNNNRVKTYYSSSFIQKLGYNPEGTLYNTVVDATGYAVINNEDGSKTFFAGNYGKNVVDHYKPLDKKAQLSTTSQSSLPANVGDVFTINKVSGAVKAVISLQIAPNDSNNHGSYLGTYMSEEIDISAVATSSTFTSENVRYFTINVNSGVTNETGINGNIFNIVNSYYGKNAHNGATVKIVQFDANGNVLNITSVTIAAPHNAE